MTANSTPRPRAEKPPAARAAKPTDVDSWTSRLMDGIRNAIRRHRLNAGLTLDDVSARTASLGHPISRVVLSKIETGFRPNLTVPELLVIARALGVTPISLAMPVTDSVEVTPGSVVQAKAGRDWWAGTGGLPALGATPATRPSAIQSLDMPALLRAQAAALTAEANRLDPPRVPVDRKIPNE